MASASTRYEVIIETEGGCSRRLVAYTARRSRQGIMAALRTNDALLDRFEGKVIRYAGRAEDGWIIEEADGALLAEIRFSGRTLNEIEHGGERALPLFGEETQTPAQR